MFPWERHAESSDPSPGQVLCLRHRYGSVRRERRKGKTALPGLVSGSSSAAGGSINGNEQRRLQNRRGREPLRRATAFRSASPTTQPLGTGAASETSGGGHRPWAGAGRSWAERGARGSDRPASFSSLVQWIPRRVLRLLLGSARVKRHFKIIPLSPLVPERHPRPRGSLRASL